MSSSQRRSAMERLDCIDCQEWELHSLSLVLRTPVSYTPATKEPFGKVVCQYMDTLCTTQKQTYLTNCLLQGITIFNENDSTK